MKKVLIMLSVVLLSAAFIYGTADAVTGQCSNCHTMHNSQNGSAMAILDDSGTSPDTTPNETLLITSCVACHSTTSTGQKNTVTNAPAVYHTNGVSGGQGAGSTNAGGDFYWVKNTGDAYGHNVDGIAAADGALSGPPGFDATATSGKTFDGKSIAVGTTWSGQQVTCAGTYGCHGTRDSAEPLTAVKGAHHGNTGGTATQASAPTTVGNSYRFLAGIKGLENADWNWNETSASHNEYYGKDDNANYGDTATMSFLCAECHGQFHKDISRPSSPWTRHPTDITLPNSSEYAAYTTYNVQAPVARPTVPASSSATVTPGDSTTDTGAIVMCLSCHRAHGSDQPDLLRWDYEGMVAGTTGSSAGTGCFVCHSGKDGS